MRPKFKLLSCCFMNLRPCCVALLAFALLPWALVTLGAKLLHGGWLGGDGTKGVWRRWYGFMLNLDDDSEFHLMNWGLWEPSWHRCVGANSEPAQANLYLRLCDLGDIVWKGSRVLEVGSGRGHGARLVSDCFCPASVVGLDLVPEQTASSARRLARDGPCPLRYETGDAEQLPFAAQSYDVVLSVESSHAYPNFTAFVANVHRVLRPGGSLLLTDFRDVDELPSFRKVLDAHFGVPKVRDISDQVAQSLRKDISTQDAPRSRLVQRLCPSFLQGACRSFVGEAALQRLEEGRARYVMLAYTKGASKLEAAPEVWSSSMAGFLKEAQEKPLLWRGGARALLPIQEVLEILKGPCGNMSNAIPVDLQNDVTWWQKLAMGLYFLLTGRSPSGGAPKDLSSFLPLLERASSWWDRARFRLDNAVAPGLYYFGGQNFKGHPRHGGICPELARLFCGRTDRDGWRVLPPASGRLEECDIIIFGGLEGTSCAPVHEHVSWLEMRDAALKQGYLWLQVTVLLRGRKTWVVYKSEAREHLGHYSEYSREAEKGAADLELYRKSHFAGAKPNTTAWQATLEPGDVMAVPSSGLHQVFNEQHSLALTFPVAMKLRQKSSRTGLRRET